MNLMADAAASVFDPKPAMRCFKLLGERVMASDFDRQIVEL